jgi:hypothetical protein
MNLMELQRKLIAAARAIQPSDRVPLAFEKRIMALIAARAAAVDKWAFWAKSLWRAAALCVVVTALISSWAMFKPAPDAGVSTDLSQQFDTTMLAALDQDSDYSW